MSIPTFHQADHLKRAWGGLPAALLSVVAALAAVAAVAIFFPIDPEVRATLRFIGAGLQQTTSGIKAINDSLAAEQHDLKMLSDQFFALAARLNTLRRESCATMRSSPRGSRRQRHKWLKRMRRLLNNLKP
jgi:hypothetical protein